MKVADMSLEPISLKTETVAVEVSEADKDTKNRILSLQDQDSMGNFLEVLAEDTEAVPEVVVLDRDSVDAEEPVIPQPIKRYFINI